MKLNLKEIKAMTCIELEQHFGLNEGTITSISSHPDGTMEINTTSSLSSKQKESIESKLSAKIV
mgnify:CR=1 FL=1|jgi:hypothetical protein